MAHTPYVVHLMFHREFGDLDVLVYRSALNKVYVYFSTKYYNVKKQLQI